jgi:anti-sigma regulatory factor (Ser/Thr protein kinase)/biotin operon repressor
MVAMLDKHNIRRRALALIAEDGLGVAGRLAAEFGLSRQAANAHLQALVREGRAEAEGSTRARVYRLATLRQAQRSYARQGLSEDVVWAEVFAPIVADLPQNVRDIWHYGVTEMVNNAIDHSGSDEVQAMVWRTALYTEGLVIDKGEGIFRKIQKALALYDPREAILELAKGKLTTDPANHSGEGIFFTSKMFDSFHISSRHLHFWHGLGEHDMMLEWPEDNPGTLVGMRLDNDSPRTPKEVFLEFAAPEEYTFDKTLVPVRLAQYEGEKLVSRSQAKRLYQRFERFRNVVLDFAGVAEIGQAFADELFRVFVAAHPAVALTPINMTQAVEQMVRRVRAGA